MRQMHRPVGSHARQPVFERARMERATMPRRPYRRAAVSQMPPRAKGAMPLAPISAPSRCRTRQPKRQAAQTISGGQFNLGDMNNENAASPFQPHRPASRPARRRDRCQRVNLAPPKASASAISSGAIMAARSANWDGSKHCRSIAAPRAPSGNSINQTARPKS